MNFAESVKYVETATREPRERSDLSVVEELLKRLGSPHNDFKSIHIAGTNGKGSVCAFVESALREEGYKTGLFVSPYILIFNERIQINGINIEDNKFASAATGIRQVAEEMQGDGYPAAAFFELLIAITFVIFRDEKVDVAVIETGIGGTYDATNVITPILSIITSIGYDHMNILGNSIDQITENKAGIIKPNCPVVVSNQNYPEAYAVLLNAAQKKNAPLFSLSKADIRIGAIGFDGAKFNFIYDSIKADIQIPLIGYHQVQNAACAFLALCVLQQYTQIKIKPESILNGIKKVEWICRLEVVQKDPLMIIDGSHNEQAVEALVKTMGDFLPDKKVNVIFGVMQRKNYMPMAKRLSEIAKKIYTVSIDENNSVNGAELAQELNEDNIDAVYAGSLSETLLALGEDKSTPVLVCGSLYLAGRARRLILP